MIHAHDGVFKLQSTIEFVITMHLNQDIHRKVPSQAVASLK